jgi:hypothetical protein
MVEEEERGNGERESGGVSIARMSLLGGFSL